MLKNIFLVAAGGGAGAVLRYLVSLAFKTSGYPWATFLVNVLGSFILGVIVALTLQSQKMNPGTRLFLATGFCGGFTTFSTFSVENLTMLQDGKIGLSAVYIATSFIAGIISAWLGFKLIQQ